MNRCFALFFVQIVIINAALAHDLKAPSSIEHYPLERVSEHIYVVHGTQALPSPATRGFMNNPAAILTNNGVVIIDPGSSSEISRQLLKKVRQVSDSPVVAVFNTHVHGDHWLGNHGVREAYPDVPIYAHQRMIERVKAGEGDNWIKLLMGMTRGAMADTRVVGPTIGLEGGEELIIGGITLRFHHSGKAHTDHDLMIEVVNDKGLFFGDIVASKRVPNSDVPQDASFKGTIAAIKTMMTGQSKIFIPGHGHSGGRDVPDSSLRFLEVLYSSVTKYYEQGLADYEMKDKVIKDLEEYKDWNNFNEIGLVISFVYQEVERDSF